MPRLQRPLRPCSLAYRLQRPVVPLVSVCSSRSFSALRASEEAFPYLQFQVWVQTALPAYSTSGRGDIPACHTTAHLASPLLWTQSFLSMVLALPAPSGALRPSPTFHSLPQEPPGSHCLLEHSPRARVIPHTCRLL